MVHHQESPIDDGTPEKIVGNVLVTQFDDVDSVLISTICQQLVKALKGKDKSESSSSNFAGTVLNSRAFHTRVVVSGESWIVDTEATEHMCCNESLFRNVQKSVMVGLPDGFTVKVHKSGDVILNDKIVLKDVLYIPEFKQNLFSVKRLLDHDHCLAVSLLRTVFFRILQLSKFVFRDKDWEIFTESVMVQ